ncbi:MAG: hypothetical protein AVDCRST_MAG56-4866 [uncultured Cytophagales bacterium]|uniref:Uncharacterized protein n=1 Tax=uncultured Cytophagales bacterium TaxID=158755 RepID=A0A6J4K1L3_9SPHI|nr:MAG: hypothetical protein AVDCRST_MAG56-4866 [uncultured Cytophagales bacterium]
MSRSGTSRPHHCGLLAGNRTGWRGVACWRVVKRAGVTCWREAVLRADYGFRLWRNKGRFLPHVQCIASIAWAAPLPVGTLAQASACAFPSQASACPFRISGAPLATSCRFNPFQPVKRWSVPAGEGKQGTGLERVSSAGKPVGWEAGRFLMSNQQADAWEGKAQADACASVPTGKGAAQAMEAMHWT